MGSLELTHNCSWDWPVTQRLIPSSFLRSYLRARPHALCVDRNCCSRRCRLGWLASVLSQLDPAQFCSKGWMLQCGILMLGPFKTLYIGYLAVWEVPVQELQFRLFFAWQSTIQGRLSHRPGFAGLDQADPSLTREAISVSRPWTRHRSVTHSVALSSLKSSSTTSPQ